MKHILATFLFFSPKKRDLVIILRSKFLLPSQKKIDSVSSSGAVPFAPTDREKLVFLSFKIHCNGH